MTYLTIFLVIINSLLVLANLYLTYRWSKSVNNLGEKIKLKEEVVLDHMEELERLRYDSFIKGDSDLQTSVDRVKKLFMDRVK